MRVAKMNNIEWSFLAIQLIMMVIYPFLFVGGHPNPWVELPLGLSFLFVGLLTTEANKGSGAAILVLVGVIGLWVGEIYRPDLPFLTMIRLGIFILFLMRAIFVFARRVFSLPGVTPSNRLIGAISIYLQIMALFGYSYMLAGQFDASSVLCSSAVCGDFRVLPKESGLYLYFSTIVMTSVGFGDFIPGAPVTTMLASLEAMIGQLYVAIVIARLVSARDESMR